MYDILGKVLILVAIAGSIAFGVSVQSPILGVLVPAMFLFLGYIMVRAPRIAGLIDTHGAKALVGLGLSFVAYTLLAAIGYGIGRIFS